MFGGGGIMVGYGEVSGVGLSLILPVKGNVIASAYQYILDNDLLPTL